ncbi:MAG: hypothetical protein K1X72_07800 [Pyrinomonadaceae bacterium]|nr:hypothetical protein [Pyrinomonadaceae bacterium]
MIKNYRLKIWQLFSSLLLFTTQIYSQNTELKIDPMMLISVKECRNITKSLGGKLYPDWHFEQTPILFYRPGVQEILINFPRQPKGYQILKGVNLLGNETIYFRDKETVFDQDDQNTTTEIEGIRVLVVADTFSRMRNQLQFIANSSDQKTKDEWFKNWNFISSPYDEMQMILHESFHVYQDTKAPKKNADEGVIARYPVLDPVNNALYVLEGNIIKDALLATDKNLRREKIKEFTAVRSFRQSRLEKDLVEYENLNEFKEGLAKYVEYKFLQDGENITPISEMWYRNGFHGYQSELPKLFENVLQNMVKIIAVDDDRFGNKYGSGPLRFKLYDLGAAQALMLEDIMPAWKETIFNDKIYLSDLLKQSLNFSAGEQAKYLEKAKSEYNYEQALQNKIKFETEGKQKIQEKLDAILKTKNTLVKINFGTVTNEFGIGYTPFGVTNVGKNAAIYEMVPIGIRFKKGVVLQMKQAIPVLIDKDAKTVAFAISTDAAKFENGIKEAVETDEFSLKGAKSEIKRDGNKVEINLYQ